MPKPRLSSIRKYIKEHKLTFDIAPLTDYVKQPNIKGYYEAKLGDDCVLVLPWPSTGELSDASAIMQLKALYDYYTGPGMAPDSHSSRQFMRSAKQVAASKFAEHLGALAELARAEIPAQRRTRHD